MTMDMELQFAADMHMHTTGSDGTDTLEDRIEQAHERGLDAIAITDHDRIIDELGPGWRTHNGLDVITGVEIRADLLQTKVELLGYFVDPEDSVLSSVLERARQFRRERNRDLVKQLNDATDLRLDYEKLTNEVRGGLGRPHLAERLVQEGYVDGINAAFEEYLAESGTCFVPMERLPCEEVIDAIRSAGGIASLAHPGRIRSSCVEAMVAKAADNGLDAIETWYPYGDDEAFDVADADRLARKYDLLRTGGSDCHGRGSGKFRIGRIGMTRDAYAQLREYK